MSPRAGTGRRAAAAQQFTLNKRREDRKGLSRAADAETVRRTPRPSLWRTGEAAVGRRRALPLNSSARRGTAGPRATT